MSPRTTRRRLLHLAGTAGVVGLAGCNDGSSSPGGDGGSSTPRNEGGDGYDILVRHQFDYEPAEGDPFDVRLALEVRALPHATAVEGSLAFEESVTLAPEPTTRRFTDAFAGSDPHEWVVTAELRALVGEEPLLDGDDVVDAPDTSASDVYRFQPGSDRDPENDVVLVTTDDDDSEENEMTLEEVSVDSWTTLQRTPTP